MAHTELQETAICALVLFPASDNANKQVKLTEPEVIALIKQTPPSGNKGEEAVDVTMKAVDVITVGVMVVFAAVEHICWANAAP